MTPIPAEPPIGGPLWSVVIPVLLLLFTAAATWLLYRHFSKQEPGQQGESDDARDRP